VHPPAPQVMKHTGPILSKARIVPIVFDGDAWSGDITKYVAAMTTPTSLSWWTAVGEEYGISQPTSSPLVTVHETPPTSITDDEIKVWLSAKLDGTHADFGAPDSNTIYTIFYDYGTSITLQPGFDSCTQFGGYHEETTAADGTKIVYAVMPRCSGFVAGASDFDGMTAAASHEWIEAASDPFGRTDPAYLFVDEEHAVWRAFPGAELGDMCAFESTAFFFDAPVGYELQRTWSNVAAFSSHDPCVPPFSAPYFNSVPAQPDDETIDLGDPTGPARTKGVRIGVGAKRTIDVDLFSDAPTSGPWTVDAVDVFALLGSPTSLAFSFDKGTGSNGDVLHLTITRMTVGEGGGSEFMLRSKLGSIAHYWYGWVGN
jgi:hypothetical protein